MLSITLAEMAWVAVQVLVAVVEEDLDTVVEAVLEVV
jgi:hypothetical protein